MDWYFLEAYSAWVLERQHLTANPQRALWCRKCKLRAKSCVHWLGMYRETENLVNSWSACQKYHNSQQKEPMIPSEIPSRPWQTVSADLLNAQQSCFLIVSTTTLSSHLLRSFTTSQPEPSLKRWKMLFAENGIPKSLQCENSTQFTSGEFPPLPTWPWVRWTPSPDG